MQAFVRVVLLLALAVPPAFGADENLQICAAGGFFSGAQDRFMSGIAAHILAKRGVLGTSPCSALWKSTYDVGASFSKTGKYSSNTDAEVGKQAADFSAKVYSAVAKSMGFKLAQA